ncbi:hypothetical protein D9615_009239 [Tricholomella constricta]|uniref:Uncharacterized protein n=1 Tax=Tricholomella constricta TaxID=117010 RepID=A0A8H5GWV3_9AGAR|nr:hypothetical protein D9615_009239 [Tricholomella constricta]
MTDPATVDPRRPAVLYNLNIAGFHKYPGTSYAQHTTADIVKVVFKLENLRHDAGKLAGFSEIIRGSEAVLFHAQWGDSHLAWFFARCVMFANMRRSPNRLLMPFWQYDDSE